MSNHSLRCEPRIPTTTNVRKLEWILFVVVKVGGQYYAVLHARPECCTCGYDRRKLEIYCVGIPITGCIGGPGDFQSSTCVGIDVGRDGNDEMKSVER